MVILIIWAPFLWGLAILGSILLTVSIVRFNGKKLAILGMDQSGKTHYFHFLQGKEYAIFASRKN